MIRFFPVILVTTLTLTGTAQQVNPDHWSGTLGEYLNLHLTEGPVANAANEGRLLARLGYPGNALRTCRKTLARYPDKKAGLQPLIDTYAAAYRPSRASQLALAILDRPKSDCHWQESDLPQSFRQATTDDRLHRQHHFPNSREKALINKFPRLAPYQYYFQRLWVSPNRRTIALLVSTPELSLIVSRDAGRNWSPPMNLGLHRLPYKHFFILHDSLLPLLDRHDNLQLEIWYAEVDPDGPQGGFAGYRYLSQTWHKTITTPTAVLAADSDRDGLTNLFEETILTDPISADTDGDGLPDASDNQPLSPYPEKVSPEDGVVIATLGIDNHWFSYFFGLPEYNGDSRLYEFPDDSSMHRQLSDRGKRFYLTPSTRLIPPQHSQIVIAQHPFARSITGNRRLIVVDGEVAKRYQRKYGTKLSHTVLTLLCADDHQRAFLSIVIGNHWSSYAFERINGAWYQQLLSKGNWD